MNAWLADLLSEPCARSPEQPTSVSCTTTSPRLALRKRTAWCSVAWHQTAKVASGRSALRGLESKGAKAEGSFLKACVVLPVLSKTVVVCGTLGTKVLCGK